MAKGRKIIWTRGNCFRTKGCWYCFRAMRTLQCSTRTARAPFRHCCESSHAGSHWLPVPGICLLLHRCYRSIRGSKAQLLASSWEPLLLRVPSGSSWNRTLQCSGPCSALSHTQADFSSPFLRGDSRKLTASVPTSVSASRNSNSGRSLK